MYGAEHVAKYEETDGEIGFDWGEHGAKILILTTTGRKSGKQRKNALIFVETPGGGYAIVGSNGGSDRHPQWFSNLRADPEVKVQIKADRFVAHARVAGNDEHADLWPKLTKVWPDYDEYTKRTDRRIPIVILERV